MLEYCGFVRVVEVGVGLDNRGPKIVLGEHDA